MKDMTKWTDSGFKKGLSMPESPGKAGVFEGRLLVAMPGMGDGGYFDRSVIYVCAHSEDGAMGIIVNRQLEDVDFIDVIPHLGMTGRDITVQPDIFFGGPVEPTRGFVLHSKDYMDGASIHLSDSIALNATIDILKKIAKGQGPDKSIFTLGYAGWGEGQLEDEMAQNAWMSVDYNEDILFNVKAEDRWAAALESIGISPHHLTGHSGRA